MGIKHATLTAVADDPAYDIGSDEWNADHTADTITIATGTITVSNPAWNITQTWNAGAVTFTGLKLNVTNTASAAGSLLMDLQVGGVTQFSVNSGGTVYAAYRFEANNVFLGGNCVLTGISVSGRKLFVGGFSNVADAFTGGAGAVFMNAAGNTIYALLEQVAAGRIELNNGTTGTYADLDLFTVMTNPVTVANLPGTPRKGMRSFVTDATQTLTAGIGATVAGGGANNVPVVYDGTNWLIG